MTPSSDHVYEIPAWIARSIPARIGPDEEIWAEAYPPAGDPSPTIAFTTFETMERLAAEPLVMGPDGNPAAGVVDVWTRIVSELPLVPLFIPLNLRGLESYHGGLSALGYSASRDVKAIVYCGEGGADQQAVHEANLHTTGRVGPYTRDPERVFWWAVLVGDELDRQVVDWLRMLYGDHSDLLAFLDSHELVRAPAMYVLGDGTRSETWESWEGAVTSASIWYHGIVPGGAILLDLEYVPEGDIKAAQKIIDSWLYHVRTEEFVRDLPRLEIVRIGG